MKKFVFSLLCFAISMALCAQMEERKGYIGLTMGASIPLGDFGDNSFSNADAGFAQTGFNLTLVHFAYKFSENFGMAASWMGTAHIAKIPSFYDPDMGIGYESDEGMWSYGSLFVGLLASVPATDKLYFEFKPMIGYVVASISEFNVFVEDQQAEALGFDLMATTRYNFNEKWCALFNIDYFTAKPEFDYFKQSISSLNINVGLAYRLR